MIRQMEIKALEDMLRESDSSTLTISRSFLEDVVAEYKDCKKSESYNKGLNDAWELARKIVAHVGNGGFSAGELYKIFGDSSPYAALTLNPQEALAKLEAYEKEQAKIKVGDVVRCKKNPSCEILITATSRGLNGVHLQTDEFGRKGEVHSNICKDSIENTGKHIDISAILAEIGKE